MSGDSNNVGQSLFETGCKVEPNTQTNKHLKSLSAIENNFADLGYFLCKFMWFHLNETETYFTNQCILIWLKCFQFPLMSWVELNKQQIQL